MKNLRKTLAVLIAAAMTMLMIVIPSSAEQLEGLTFTRPMDLVKYQSPEVTAPWVPFTGWSSDNGVLKGDDWIEYCYAAIVKEKSGGEVIVGADAKEGMNWHTPEEINFACAYDRGLYSISDLDADGWTEVFKEGFGLGNRDAKISKTSFEQYNGVDYFRVDYDINGIQTINLVAPSENGDVFFLEYNYDPSTNISKKYEQDFWEVLDTVSLKQGTGTAANNSASNNTAAANDDTIKIYVNGSRVYPDSDPVIINDRTLVPIRVVAEALGYKVDWDGANQAVDIHNDDMSLYLIIGSTALDRYFYDYNGNLSGMDTIYADVAPQIINERTYLPLRAVGEGIGATVDWDGNTRSVYITGESVG